MTYLRKVRGFTLFELLIVMLIGSILLGIVYYALQIANNSYSVFARETNKLIELKTLIRTLREDMENADLVTASDGQILCHTGGDVIVYDITTQKVVRQVNGTEHVFPYSATCTFVSEQAVATLFKEPIDGLDITFDVKGEPITFRLNRNSSYFDKFEKFKMQLKN
jgi:prepilin-type N-terminal cleavage/methylation domain-containing protein